MSEKRMTLADAEALKAVSYYVASCGERFSDNMSRSEASEIVDRKNGEREEGDPHFYVWSPPFCPACHGDPCECHAIFGED